MRKGTWRGLCRLGVVLGLVVLGASAAWAQPIAYWHYNTFAPATQPQNTFAADVGTGTIYMDGTNGSSAWTIATVEQDAEIWAFAGSTSNSYDSTPAGNALTLRRDTAATNGKSVVIKFSMAGMKDLLVTYATRNTGTGFTTQQWDYSRNGTDWTPIESVSGLSTNFATKSLSTITGLDDAADAYLRLTVTGASADGGNCRLDNLQLNAAAITSDSIVLTLDKNADPDQGDGPVFPQTTVLYDITVAHDPLASSADATNVVIADVLPDGVSLAADPTVEIEPALNGETTLTLDDLDADMDGAGIDTDGNIRIDLGDLALADDYFIIFQVTIDPRTDATTLINTATVTHAEDLVGVSDTAETDVIACDVDNPCSDGDVCTTDTCEAGSCVFGLPCDDDNACTVDVCENEVCDNAGQVDCEDNNPCTLSFSCDMALGCQYETTTEPCEAETGFTIAMWTFEESVPQATNSATISNLAAEVGTGVASGVHADPTTDWENFAGNGSGESFAANNWAAGDYFQFETSTVGYDTIKLTWDQTRTSTAPATWDVLVSHDGTNFEPLVEVYAVGTDSWSSIPENYVPASHFGPVPLGPQFSDRQTLVVRIVAHETNGTGNVRVDNVTIGGLPITGTPHLEALKADDFLDPVAIPGDIFFYDIVVDHNATSTRTAVDIEIRDQLPDGLTATDMEISLSGGTPVSLTLEADEDAGEIDIDGVITVRVAELGLTEWATLSVLVSVDPRTTAADLSNTATITWYDHGTGGPYTVDSNTEVTAVAECIDNADCTSQCLDNAVCDNGTCTGDVVTCNDSKSCTTDTCDPDTGCVYSPVDLNCSDGFSCTTDTCDPDDGDANATTGCVIVPVHTECTDTFACTDNTCDPDGVGADPTTGCLVTERNDLCDDSKSCTTNTCDPDAGGADADGCTFPASDAACDDGKSCTIDTCEPADPAADATSGCVLEPDDTACSDGVSCTVDVCDPDDGSADADSGCVLTPDNSLCDDDVGCTVDVCNATTGCENTPNNALCNDNKPCTDDTCDAEDGCVFTNDNTNTCADTNLCNGNETCVGGTCTAGTAVVCNDNNPCTNDSCNPANGLCASANNTDSCNDNNANTHTDTCTSGTCVGTAVVCDTPNQCQTIGTPNGTSSCPPVNKTNGTTCDDGSLTTHTDVCTAGVCAGTTIVCPAPGVCELAGTPNGVDCTKNFATANTPCDDGDLTTATDVCDGAGACAGTTIVCPTPTQCQTAGTPDGTSCVPVNKPATEPCDDGDVATSGDTCDGAGACIGTAITCPEDTACGTYAPNGTDCTLTPLTGACDDGDVNTHSDTCVEGACQGTAYACVPSQCELDSVANGTDCTVTFKDAATACDDGDVNTRDDVCDGAGACAGDAYTCTPGVCEASSVPDGTGCVVTPSLPGDSCEDGDPCTTDDVCDTAGLCMGEAVVCGDGEVCGDDGTCRLTHCTTCAEDGECGANSTCVALEAGNRCLVTCETDLDCALNQTCAAAEDGAMHCYDLTGTCAAPVVNPEEDPEVVEPSPEIAEPEPEPEEVEPEPEPEEVEPLPEEVEPEPGPEPVETVEPVEPAPDATAEAEDDKVVASGGGCSGGGTTSGALALLVGALALAGMRRRQPRGP